MYSSDSAAPVDRPNLSKDYLAGSAPEDWLPLRPDSFYAENDIDLHLNAEVTGIDIKKCEIVAGGKTVAFDRLLLATGAEPVRLGFRAPTCRMSTRFVRWPTAAPSSVWLKSRDARW